MSRVEPREKVIPDPPRTCPQCGAAALEAVDDGELTNFFCHDCAACWHVELDHIHRVDATTCPGCEHLGTCLLAAALERSTEA